MSELIERCVCGRTTAEAVVTNGISTLVCDCGVVRQSVHLTRAELAAWYRDKYHGQCYSHSYEHDVSVAKLRLGAYKLSAETKLLDVGSGNGAFIAAARALGIDAWGQEVAATSDSEFTYVGALEDIAFPTDSFDVVTLHDVLEHLVDPLATLKEIRRILRRPGKLIVDFPAFWEDAGKHHWKVNEHLWMFTTEELIDVIEHAGFRTTAWSRPIPSKTVVEAEPLPEERPQILVPAGIGDAYWVLTKLPGFLKHRGLPALADVWVQDSGGPKRTQPYLRNVPSINAAGYKTLSDRDPLFHEAYMQNRRTVFDNVLGVDHFIAYNGVMRAGRSLDDVDPEFGCNWHPKLHVSKEAQKMRERMEGPGRYILAYWVEAGMYRHWLADFSADRICDSLRMLQKRLDCRVVFMGAPWDRGQVGADIAKMDPSFETLIGSTTFDQMLGLIQGATAVVGYPAGNTILAAALNVPTVLLWNEYFVENFWRYAAPPDANYAPMNTRGLTREKLVTEVIARIEADSR